MCVIVKRRARNNTMQLLFLESFVPHRSTEEASARCWIIDTHVKKNLVS